MLICYLLYYLWFQASGSSIVMQWYLLMLTGKLSSEGMILDCTAPRPVKKLCILFPLRPPQVLLLCLFFCCHLGAVCSFASYPHGGILYYKAL